MYTCVYTDIYICVYTYIYIYILTCIYVHMCVFIHVYLQQKKSSRHNLGCRRPWRGPSPASAHGTGGARSGRVGPEPLFQVRAHGVCFGSLKGGRHPIMGICGVCSWSGLCRFPGMKATACVENVTFGMRPCSKADSQDALPGSFASSFLRGFLAPSNSGPWCHHGL